MKNNNKMNGTQHNSEIAVEALNKLLNAGGLYEKILCTCEEFDGLMTGCWNRAILGKKRVLLHHLTNLKCDVCGKKEAKKLHQPSITKN